MEVGEEEKWVGMPMAGHWGLQLLARTEGQQQGAGQERLVCSRCCLCPARLHSVCLSVCLPESLFLSFSLSLGLGVSLSAPPHPPRLCLGAWHTLAAVLPLPVSCPPGTLPPLVYRSWKNPLASRRPKRPQGREEADPGVGKQREGQPWGTGLGGRQRRPGCVGMGISSCGQGLTGNLSRSQWHGKLLPQARALEVPFPPASHRYQLLQGRRGAVPT